MKTPKKATSHRGAGPGSGSSHSKPSFTGEDTSGTLVMRSDGLYLVTQNDDASPRSIRVSDPFRVTGNLSGSGGRAYALAISWRDDRGRTHQRVIPLRLFSGTNREICAPLLDEGMRIEPKMQGRFGEYLWKEHKRAPKADLTTRIGWYDGWRFVFPDEVIADPNCTDNVVYSAASEDLVEYFQVAGTLPAWRENVASLCVGNSRLIMAISMAFAAVLLAPIGAESIGVHLRGTSSLGKTTAQYVAGSVWGGGGKNGVLRSWRSTINGLEGIAVAHNDSLLCLDELSQVEPRDAINAIYLLMNGASKNRAHIDGSARRGSAWTIILLSSGELSLAEHAEKRTKGGAEIRFLEIAADAGAGLGLFENLHGTGKGEREPSKAFANRLKSSSRKYYGHAIRDFVRQFCELGPELQMELILNCQRTFMEMCELDGVTPEVGRAAQSMALIAAAGEIASLFGITGWEPGEANEGVHRCFCSWIAARGGSKTTHDEQQGIAVIQRCIEQSGNSRFEPIQTGKSSEISDEESDGNLSDRVIHNRIGFKRKTKAGQTEFLFLPEMFKAEVCAGFDYRMVLKALAKRGLLRREGSAMTLSARLPGLGKTRVYCVSSEIVKTCGE